MSRYRKSYSLSKIKSRLRAEALKTEDEELAKLFWSLYYDARNAEYEVDVVVLETEIRRLVEIMVQHGLVQRALDELKAQSEQADDEQSNTETSTYLKRDLPKQKRLF